MTYRKFKADFLFTGTEWLDANYVLITDENGTVHSIVTAEEGQVAETYSGILCPGFVNCHCHLELSHLRGIIPEGTGIVDFLLSVTKTRNSPLAVISRCIANAEKEMLENGIVVVGDICNTVDSLTQKKQGRLYYHNFIEAIGFSGDQAEKRMEAAIEVFRQFAGEHPQAAESNSVVPHAPYSVSEKLLDLIACFPGNQVLCMHNQESEEENQFMMTGTGDFQRLYASLGIDISSFRPARNGNLTNRLSGFRANQSIILVHNVATREGDLQRTGPGAEGPGDPASLFFCLCPNANLYISGQLPDIDLFRRHHCIMVMGTDSLASNHQLNVLEELKTIQRCFPEITTGELLRWATFHGALALRLDGQFGSFETGKQPGIVLIEKISGDRLTADSRARRIL